ALRGDLLLQLVLRLVERLDRLRLDPGDAEDRRSESSIEHAAHRVRGKRESSLGDLRVDDLVAGDEAEIDVRGLQLTFGDEIVEGLARGKRRGGSVGFGAVL